MAEYKKGNYKNVLHSKQRRGIKEDILNLRKQGKSYKEIQVVLNCSKGSIAYHTKIAGLDGMIEFTHHNQLGDADKKKIMNFTKKDKNIAKAIRELGFSRQTILKYGDFESVK